MKIFLLAAVGCLSLFLSLCLYFEHSSKIEQVSRLTASLENATQELVPAEQRLTALTQKYEAEKHDLNAQLDTARRQSQDALKNPGKDTEELRKKSEELTQLQTVFLNQKENYEKSQKSVDDLIQKYEKEKQDLASELATTKANLENALKLAAAKPAAGATPKKNWIDEKIDHSPTALDLKPTPAPYHGPHYWVDINGFRHYYSY